MKKSVLVSFAIETEDFTEPVKFTVTVYRRYYAILIRKDPTIVP